jgi:putative ABC transport system ATP-binding protein
LSDRPAAIAVDQLRFAYRAGREVLQIESFSIAAGERVFLHGPSGTGKTTLLGLIAGVLNPTSGRVSVLGQDLAKLRPHARDNYRGVHLGYLFQLFNLIPWLSVVDNIALPVRLHRERAARMKLPVVEEARRLAEQLELHDFIDTPVTDLSVGQQQRVAAARALIGAPQLVIADEPTSALDTDLRDRFLQLLFAQCAEVGATLLFVSHDLSLGKRFDRTLSLGDLNRAGKA